MANAPVDSDLPLNPLVRSTSSFYYYDPYEKRTVEVPLNNIDAFISLLKCVIGTGILAMPLAIRYSGIVPGVLLSMLLMILLTYCIHLLITGMTECCRRIHVPQVSMPEAVQIAYTLGPGCVRGFANAAGFMTSCVLVFGQFGLCCVYLVFVAKNIKEIGDYYWKDYNERFYVLALSLLQLPFSFIRKLKYLVPLNLISNCLLYVGFLSIMYYLVMGLPNLSEREMFRPPNDWAMFFGIAAFSLTAVGSMIVVEANMKHPECYLGLCGVLNLAVFFILCSNLLFGIMGYWRFGDRVEASITLNIPRNEILSLFIHAFLSLSQIIKISIASGIFLSYPLNAFVVVTVVFSDYGKPEEDSSNNFYLEILVRVIFVLLTGIVAAVVPNLAALTELEGAFSLCNLNLLCPALIDIFVNYDTGYGPLRWMLLRDIILIVIGIFFGIVGCTVAIHQLMEDFRGTIKEV